MIGPAKDPPIAAAVEFLFDVATLLHRGPLRLPRTWAAAAETGLARDSRRQVAALVLWGTEELIHEGGDARAAIGDR